MLLAPRADALDRVARIQHDNCMKTITVNVSEPVYRDFQNYARQVDRTASELIREAMELYREQKMVRQGMSVLEIPTASVGKVLKPLGPHDDLLAEILEGSVE
jgi:hypothetical protein